MTTNQENLRLQIGPWIDYSASWRQSSQFQVNETSAQFIPLLIPVLWGLSARGLSVILGHVYYLFVAKPRTRSPQRSPEASAVHDNPSERTRLRQDIDRSSSYGSPLRPGATSESAEAEVGLAAGQEQQRSVPAIIGHKHYFLQLALIFIWGILGVRYGTRLTQYDTGLASAENCGHFSLSSQVSRARQIEDDTMLQEPKEARAAYYAKQCYQKPGLVADANLCAIFYKPTIPYLKESYSEKACPFSESGICAEPRGAIQFTTGIFDVSLLGINSPKPAFARRTSICTPLSVSEGYVKRKAAEDGKSQITYWYGGTSDALFTFNSSSDTYSTEFPTYAVTTRRASPRGGGYWSPHADLGRPANTYLSMFFITTGHIRYQGESNGFVFNISTPFFGGNPAAQYWRNSDKEIRPVACIDFQDYCTSKDGDCVPATQDTEDPVLELVRRALMRSTMVDSIVFRMGRELLAQDVVTQYISAQLSEIQWELEFEQLFRTSLARMQFNVLDIAVGDGKELRNYEEVDKKAWGNGKLCGMYKYSLPRTSGQKNFDLVFFATSVTAFGLFIFFTAPWIYKDNKPEEQSFLGEKVAVYAYVPGWLSVTKKYMARRNRRILSGENLPEGGQPRGALGDGESRLHGARAEPRGEEGASSQHSGGEDVRPGPVDRPATWESEDVLPDEEDAKGKRRAAAVEPERDA